ncbi:response regulator [Fodinibius halophilus]|uniref:Response regulator transcription factor n=1 Tax=Fodinibius halophilus TaxID=1736908 RepID=A0A6M1SWV9_9BACT|nr:response regulator transcription factor [Fodinibius halophilus]NGP88358.1 response regulator transcription factor [Fodinibius halophilus]
MHSFNSADSGVNNSISWQNTGDPRLMNRTICICDDHPVIAEGIEYILSKENGQAQLHTTKTGKKCLHIVQHYPLDLLILDLKLPDINGLDLLKKIREQQPDLPILVLTMHKDPFILDQIQKLGGDGYMLKDFGRKEFLRALKTIDQQKFYVSPGIRQSLERDSFSGTLQLTKREKEIIKYTASGKSAQEVGDLLYISKHTVNTHRRNIYKKLDISGVKELINFAHENGLV